MDILNIEKLQDKEEPPMYLLELADPSINNINAYLKSGTCFVAKQKSEIIGIIVLDEINHSIFEIKNIAVKESYQGKGFGKLLLKFAEEVSNKLGYKKLRIGTGNSSIGQLALYQKLGFEISRINKDFFIKNYKKPIFENGIQCKHMILLEKELK